VLEANARKFAVTLGPDEIGRVIEAGDGIARVDGLPGVMAEEMVLFPGDIHGMVMNLGRDEVGVVVLGDYSGIEQGSVVRRTGEVFRVPVGAPLLGRVVNPLGEPLDGRGPINAPETRRAEADAPDIARRTPVNRPLVTGLKCVDAMTAIGRGQRELIIGDRQTGKTTMAVDAILSQMPADVRCVYVAIGQKMSTVSRVVELLDEYKVRENSIVVVAAAGDSAPLQYMAPFCGCAMAEYFRDRGEDALIIYDDLSKHAVAYREISLLLRRPPGREAFPGDIFYLHSRLLERAACLSEEGGGGTLTALPIVETKQGDYSAYIPTNLISITDGQIYLEDGLFHQGFRPAMNVGLSVSRVGGRAQLPAMKRVAGRLRIDLAQYREVASFSQLTSDLDAATLRQLHRGERLTEILKQDRHATMPIERQVCALWAVTSGHMDHLPLEDIPRAQNEWLAFLDTAHASVGRRILAGEEIAGALEADLAAAMAQFRNVFVSTGRPETMSARRVVPMADDRDEHVAATVGRAG